MEPPALIILKITIPEVRVLRLFFLVLVLTAATALGQQNTSPQQQPDAPAAQSSDQKTLPPPQQPGVTLPSTEDTNKAAPPEKQQPKRILGIMPNFRAVSAGTLPPPPTPKESFMIATKNSFDYSSVVFVGLTSAIAEGTDAHPQLGKGMPGFGRYFWRGFVDKTDGNYWVIFIYPTLFHQDSRYFSKGEGHPFTQRLGYAASRIFITPDYHGHNTFNFSEVLGRATAQAISLSYYPSQTRTGGEIAKKYGFALGRDALTNIFREVWPDIATKLFHKKP
jgi:hypothetical protein